jgi:DNA polymerase I-like protein with 3'-5' exonuclease and polymerase domains
LARDILGLKTDDKDEIEVWLKENTRRFMRDRGRRPNFRDAPIEVVKRRVLWDTKATLLLFNDFWPKIQNICPALYKTEQKLLFCCVQLENRGVLVDVTRAKFLRAQARRGIAQVYADLLRIVGPIEIVKTKTRKRKGEKFVEEYTEQIDQFNPGSNVHLEAVFKKCGIELKYITKPKKKKNGDKTGGGKWCFDEYAMIRYVSSSMAGIMRESSEEGWPVDKFYEEIHKIVKPDSVYEAGELIPPLILKYRELTKMISTYYDHIIEDSIDKGLLPDGREVATLHCRFNQDGADTGRFSSSEINLQNIPRIMGPRECFITRPGFMNWHFDYKQVEIKFFVHFAKDEGMAAEIDKDIHAYTGAKIYQCTKEQLKKEQRKRAKAVNFGIIYGSGKDTLAETLTKRGLPTSSLESTVLLAGYHKEFPLVKKTTAELKRDLTRNGYITNPYGRRYHIKTKFGYRALNYMCQGTSADLMKRGMADMWEWLLERPWLETQIIMTVHDEIVLEIARGEEHIIVPEVIRLMEDHESFFVPMTVDTEVVPERWNSKQDPTALGFRFDHAA